jgi:hypothetical protein
MLYYFNYKLLHNKEAQCERKYIAKFFFSIFNLFYNANVLKMYNNIKLRVSVTNFVNDVNILIYKKLIERNCKTLN